MESVGDGEPESRLPVLELKKVSICHALSHSPA